MIIIIPAYEPDQRMITLLRTIQDKWMCTVIVVNDGSGEEYDSIFKKAEKYATVLNFQQNRGKGSALKSAYREILKSNLGKNEFVITVDADGQHKVEDIEKLKRQFTLLISHF